MERAVFRAGLDAGTPMIWVTAADPQTALCNPPVRRALDRGRLLVVSHFRGGIETPSLRRAAWCNHYVLAHSRRIVIGFLNPGGLLSCLLTESNPATEVAFL